ncbi:hypothetical protein EDD85DRAFT_797172 [Armillaria nabsnona]|nr:hypothetical protein EDD85DRAFT_797172 [Armillaria nabsnona]
MTLDIDVSFTLNILLDELEHFHFGLKPGIDSKQLRMGLQGAHEALDVLERMADWIDQADLTEWEEVVQEHEKELSKDQEGRKKCGIEEVEVQSSSEDEEEARNCGSKGDIISSVATRSIDHLRNLEIPYWCLPGKPNLTLPGGPGSLGYRLPGVHLAGISSGIKGIRLTPMSAGPVHNPNGSETEEDETIVHWRSDSSESSDNGPPLLISVQDQALLENLCPDNELTQDILPSFHQFVKSSDDLSHILGLDQLEIRQMIKNKQLQVLAQHLVVKKAQQTQVTRENLLIVQQTLMAGRDSSSLLQEEE